MRISDWSSDVCSSDLAVLENRLGAYGITPVAQKQAWRPPAGCMQRDISFHPWRKPCSRLIDHGQIEGRRRAAHRPSPGHAWPIGAQKKRFGLAIAVVDIKTQIGRAHVCTPVYNAQLV